MGKTKPDVSPGYASNLKWVDPTVGTGRRGNCLIGPCLPHGIIRLGPDTSYPQVNSGYSPGKAIIGFSHTRLAGTGGCARYGNVRVMPFIGEARRLKCGPYVTFPATDRRWSRPLREEAEVGRYKCEFAFGVSAELTSTARAGVHRYRFSAPGARSILVDFASVLQNASASPGNAPYCEDWEMEAVSTGGALEAPNEHELSARSDFRGGWGHFEPLTVYSFFRSREPFARCEIFGEEGAVSGPNTAGKALHVLLTYPETCDEINLEVGISFFSAERARSAVETESAGRPFEDIVAAARQAWIPWLNLVQAKGGSRKQHTLLATSLQRIFTQPTDLSQDGQLTPEGTPHYTDIVCLWDSIRNANSLFHLIAPEFSANLMNSLLDYADRTGWLPDAHAAGHTAFQQSGCCAEILFSEAARKDVPGVDYHRALAVCVRNAETIPPDPYYCGRYLEEYESLGYLSTRVRKASVSRHIEYTYQDWCIARLAEKLGESEIANRFDRKARRLWNLWREETKTFWPRHPDGSWADHPSADHLIGDSWNDPYTYEGSLLHWSFNGLHDIEGLIARHGGKAAFAEYLDAYFQQHGDVEKETRMHIPHLYQWVDLPARGAAVVQRSLATRYLISPDGIPDNEDMGCQSAYYICNSTGLYPIYGQTFYSIVPPLFAESVFQYGQSGKSLTITRQGSGNAIDSILLNGEILPGTMVEHAQLQAGGKLEIKLAGA